tara:strand:- start:3872 stop:4549 length:678 start_codon:yes stop_codon:yes gene_type:complete
MLNLLNVGFVGSAGSSSNEYESMYESRSELTTVQNQHFVEWFSGKELGHYWTLTQIVATCTATISDSVDGGMLFQTDSGSGSPSACLTFNNKRQYNPAGFRFISICQKNDNNLGIKGGIGNDKVVNPSHYAFMMEGSFVSYKSLETKDGSTASLTASSIALSQNAFTYDIEGTSSNVKLGINGNLEVTKTTNRPTAACQPFLYIQSRSTAAVKDYNVRYVECFNT